MMEESNLEVYEVKKGETLWEIAKKKLGDATRWREITKASDGNTYTEKEAKNIPMGERINIPKKESGKNFYKDIDRKYKNNNDEGGSKGVSSNSDITHREFLTFSNLTNLEWQFVDLKVEKQRNENGDLVKVYDKISDYLSNPKLFVETDREGNIEAYQYGANDDGEFISKEKGLAEMRSKAGIAMEYLEKDEGEFIEDWEVVYGADNYKVVKDYINHLEEETPSNKEEIEYPSRSKVDQAKEYQARIKAAFDVTGLALSVIIWNGSMNEAEQIAVNELLKKSTKKLSEKAINGTVNKLIKKTNCIPLSLISAAYFNRNSALEMLDSLSEKAETEIDQNLQETGTIGEISEVLGEKTTVEITQELNIFDTGFRVVALKRDDNTIVVSYKGKKVENDKLLPQEFDYLQMVYDKLKRDHADSETEIIFTGYEGGADLSFLNCLFSRQESKTTATLFYNNLRDLKGYTNFTPHDINKEYKSNLKINLQSGAENIGDDIAKTAFSAALATGLSEAGILSGTVTTGVTLTNFILVCIVIVMWDIIGMIKDLFESLKIKEKYKTLIELGFIEAEKLTGSYPKGAPGHVKREIQKKQSIIEGYITDDFVYQNYIELFVDDSLLLSSNRKGEMESLATIKVKKEDAIYLLLQQDEIRIKEKNYPTTLMGNKFNIEYIAFKEDVEKRETVHTMMGPRNETVEVTGLYWALEKNRNGIYRITALFDDDPTPENPLSEPVIRLRDKEKKQLSQYRMLINLMEVTGIMQRNYIERKEEAFEYIYPTQDGVKVAKKVAQDLETDLGKETTTSNEFVFMPYLQDDGYISQQTPQLRDDYIASVFKSMLQKYKERKECGYYKSMSYDSTISSSLLGSASTAKNEKGISKVKYGLKEYEKEYEYKFEKELKNISEQKGDINQEFLEIVTTKVQCRELRNTGYAVGSDDIDITVFFNYYQQVLEQLETNPELIEEYYQIEEVNGHEDYPATTHVITIHPDYKSQIEYKYNSTDEIIGGELKLYVEETEDKIKETLTTSPAIKDSFFDDPEAEEDKKDDKEEKEWANQVNHSSGNPDFAAKKKVITSLNKKSSPKQIKKAAEIVIGETKRKRKPVIAQSLEDYLAGMHTTKRVDDEELRTLDMIKTAETELRLTVDRRLTQELNYIVRNKARLKEEGRIEFEIKEKRLVHPTLRSIEEFLNTSLESKLRVEGKFEVEKITNQRKMLLKGKLSYRWDNNYRWRGGRKKLLAGYGSIEDYQFKKLADRGAARPYKMYSEWQYYLTDRLSLIKDEVDSLRIWAWREYCSFEHVGWA